MKNIFLLFMIVSGIAVSNIYCAKSTDGITPTPEETVTVTVRMNTALEYDLGIFGRDEGPVITKQPANAQVSQIVRKENNHTVYNYLPMQDFTGTDETLIQINRNPEGVNNTVSFLRIRIRVEL